MSKEPITEMDSEEFIGHIFYIVLGGVYADSEESARQGILDMLEDYQSNKKIAMQEAREEIIEFIKNGACGVCGLALGPKEIPYFEAEGLINAIRKLGEKQEQP